MLPRTVERKENEQATIIAGMVMNDKKWPCLRLYEMRCPQIPSYMGQTALLTSEGENEQGHIDEAILNRG